MSLEKAFILAYTSTRDDQLALAGRALIDLKQGDILRVLNGQPSADDPQFIIQNITAYRNTFDQISAGMTCELTVSGAGADLAKDTIFYREGQ